MQGPRPAGTHTPPQGRQPGNQKALCLGEGDSVALGTSGGPLSPIPGAQEDRALALTRKAGEPGAATKGLKGACFVDASSYESWSRASASCSVQVSGRLAGCHSGCCHVTTEHLAWLTGL